MNKMYKNVRHKTTDLWRIFMNMEAKMQSKVMILQKNKKQILLQ